MKILLVDDNVTVLQGMSMLPVWGKYNIEILTLDNPLLVLECIRNEKIDVLITDIRMPEVTGLELCRLVNQQFPWVTMIILSAYSDFEYAQQAMEYRVDKFLTKPINENELEILIEKLHLKYTLIDEYEKNNLHQLLFVKSRTHNLKTMFPLEGISGMRIVIRNEHVKNGRVIELCYNQELKHYVYLERADLDSRCNFWQHDIAQSCDGYNRMQLGGIASDTFTDLCDTIKIYNDVLHYIDILWFYPTQMYEYCKLVVLEEKRKVYPRIYSSYQFYQAVKNNDYDIKMIEIYFRDMVKGNLFIKKATVIRYMLDLILESISNHFNEKSNTFVYKSFYKQIEVAESFENALEIVLYFFKELKIYIELEETNEKEYVIRKIESYIIRNISREISIVDLSEELEISISMTSKKINEYFGMTFPVYLNQRRLEIVKEQLRNTNKTIKEIYMESGYSNMRHFLRTFKKYEEITPTEYRSLYSRN